MTDTLAPPDGWSIEVHDAAGLFSSNGTWGTDADQAGAILAGVASVRLLPTLKRTALIATKFVPVVNGEWNTLVAWVRADSVAVGNNVIVGIEWGDNVSPGAATTVATSRYYNAPLAAVDTWQRIAISVRRADAVYCAARLYVEKANTAFTVQVGAIHLHDIVPSDLPVETAQSLLGDAVFGAAYDYSIPSGRNAFVVESIAIPNESSITIPAGSALLIVG